MIVFHKQGQADIKLIANAKYKRVHINMRGPTLGVGFNSFIIGLKIAW